MFLAVSAGKSGKERRQAILLRIGQEVDWIHRSIRSRPHQSPRRIRESESQHTSKLPYLSKHDRPPGDSLSYPFVSQGLILSEENVSWALILLDSWESRDGLVESVVGVIIIDSAHFSDKDGP